MNRLPQFEKLTASEYEIFLKTHATHLQSMGDQQRNKYGLKSIVRIERNRKENCRENREYTGKIKQIHEESKNATVHLRFTRR